MNSVIIPQLPPARVPGGYPGYGYGVPAQGYLSYTPAQQKFRFGNGEVMTAEEKAQFPAAVCGVNGIIRPFIIPGGTPLLIPKSFLKSLDARLDLGNDQLELPKIGVTAQVIGARLSTRC